MSSVKRNILRFAGSLAATFALLAVPALAAPPVQNSYGTIKGRLVWGGPNVPQPEKLTINKDEQVCGKKDLYSRELVVDPKTKGIAHAFAYLPRPSGSNPEAEKELLQKEPKVEIDQETCEFLPYSTALHEKQQILFKSSDPIGHNVHYIGFQNGSKNVSLPPNGSLEGKLVAERRPLTLKCDIHPWMKGWIMVFDHPFFDVTDQDGSFEITGVPAGTQNLVVWQEKVGYVTEGAARGMAVTVKPGQVTDVGEIVIQPSQIKN